MKHGSHANAAAEMAARKSYGRLLAWLSWQWRDVCAAEDALSEAFLAALKHWPQDGVPVSPEAWLLTAAKRNLLMAARRKQVEIDPAISIILPELVDHASDTQAIPDLRLRLLFVCAHPAIDQSMHSALMLQLVLGIDAARIANVFLLSPAALSKRLTRAKMKIRDAGIPFAEPERTELPSRVASVLEAIYGLYTINRSAAFGSEQIALAEEALFLAQLTSEFMQNSAEAHGLLALFLFLESRRHAQIDGHGVFCPIDEQAPKSWRHELIQLAESALQRAANLKQRGPYQIEAAIQAAHMQSVMDGYVRWPEIANLYAQLIQLEPTIGARIGYAVAAANAGNNPAVGLKILDSVERQKVVSHQPWWAARAHLLAIAGSKEEASAAYSRAITLTSDESIRTWLKRQREHRCDTPFP